MIVAQFSDLYSLEIVRMFDKKGPKLWITSLANKNKWIFENFDMNTSGQSIEYGIDIKNTWWNLECMKEAYIYKTQN